MQKFKLGLIINPIAGIGGAVALKGSDGESTQQLAFERGAIKQACLRAQQALAQLVAIKDQLEIYTVSGEMGEFCCKALDLACQIVLHTPTVTTENSTMEAARQLEKASVDLILFAGGDGTARNIATSVSEMQLVLGIPAGCKIHSGVYAVTPTAAGQLVYKMIQGEMLSLVSADVMDIDESLFRDGIVKAKRYAEMQVPNDLRYVQAVKNSGKEVDELVVEDICAQVIETLEEDTLYLIGSGSTTKALMDTLNLESTLLGVDAIFNEQIVQHDLTEAQIWALLPQYDRIIVVMTIIGGQGHVLGRGNQQFSPRILKQVGRDNVLLIATKSKLNQLQGRPLWLDTSDIAFNKAWSGPITITTGYRDNVIYPITFEVSNE